MRSTRILPIVAGTVLLAACGDTDPMASPPDPTSTPALSVQQQTDAVMPGRVLVGLADGTDAAAFAQANGVAFERMAASGRFAIMRGAAGNERALAARLGSLSGVNWAEPDYLRQTTAIDPRMWAFYNPGGLSVAFTRGRNKGQAVGSYLSVEDADEDNVEGYAAGGAPVAIASIDTGVQFDHPEFGSATLTPGWDFYDGDADPSDDNDHGTHTTGTMVGDGVGVAGVAGAAGNVTVYVYRVCGALGCPTSAIAEAIVAATDDGVVAMNLSLGGSSISDTERNAIDYATANQALVIASAGNGGTSTVSCPACYVGSISVAATNWQDAHTYYTQYGAGLDISAPGGELYSNTTEEAGIYSSVRGGYAYFQGTSMAAPQVTGTAAVVASVTGLRGAALRSRLEGTADDLGPAGYDTDFGHGRVNAYRAVTGTTLVEGDPPPPPPPPAGLGAAFSFSCSGTACDFDGSASTGDIVSYAWSGTFSASGVTASFDFGGAGDFGVTLTVSDGTDSASTTQTVSCQTRGKRVRCN